MIRNVYLQGELGKQFGEKFSIYANNCADIVKCINANRPNFKNFLVQSAKKGLDVDVRVHDTVLDNDDLIIPLKEGDVTITLIPAGSKNAADKIGAAILIFLAFIYPPTAAYLTTTTAAGVTQLSILGSVVSGIAVSLALTGIYELLADDPEGDENPTNYLYQGDAHTIEEGDPVPLLYGELVLQGVPVDFHMVKGRTTNVLQTVEPDGAITVQDLYKGDG